MKSKGDTNAKQQFSTRLIPIIERDAAAPDDNTLC